MCKGKFIIYGKRKSKQLFVKGTNDCLFCCANLTKRMEVRAGEKLKIDKKHYR